MSVILGIVGIVYGAFIVEPDWFDDSLHVAKAKCETLKECESAKKGQEFCVGSTPSFLYVKKGE